MRLTINARSPASRNADRACGFTLIELAISVTIVGLVLAAGSQAYSIYLKRQAVLTTKNNVERVASTITSYLNLVGRYPCPASLTAQRGDVAYGHESTLGGGDCTSAALPPGIYDRTSSRTVRYSSAGVMFASENPKVRVGAVPFRELNLDESQAFDGYGNRIVYAVTERLATIASYKQDGGGVDVLGAGSASVLNPPASAHFFVYSAGENAAGAYSSAGIQGLPCPNNFPESANCGTTSPAAFAAVQASTGNNAGRFDDVVNYFTQGGIPLWQISAGDVTSIREKPDGKVGIFRPTNMGGQYRTVIPGTIHLTGSVLTDTMCDNSFSPSAPNGDCFPTSTISGNLTTGTGGIGCPAGKYLVSIDHGHANCQSEIWAYCDAGQSVRGISNTSSGTLICDTPPKRCPATSVTLCTTTTALPASPSGTSIHVTSPTASNTWTCTDGSWSPGTQTGVCDCAAETANHPPVTQAINCPSGYGNGTYTQTGTYSCTTGGYTYTDNKTTACVCKPLTINGVANCQPNPPYSGTYPTVQLGVCVAGVLKMGVTTPATQPSSCVCTPTTVVSHPACADGLVGTRTVKTTYACPSGASTVTDTTAVGDCKCQPSTSTSYQDCPAGYIPNPNGVQQITKYACTNGPNNPGTWSTTTGTSDCIVAPPKQCFWNPLTSAIPSSYPAPKTYRASCSCGTIGSCSAYIGPGSYNFYPSCSCQ